MDREANETVELIDLGVASVETQGFDVGKIDGAGYQPLTGLSDD
ncbi:benenodin family lasso peptide [Sphingomonas sp. PWP1-2]